LVFYIKPLFFSLFFLFLFSTCFRYAPQIEVLFKVDGTQASPVKDIRVSSLTLRHAAPTYMANYSVGSGGDYSVHRGGAVLLTGA
jgi:hypothetical protein